MRNDPSISISSQADRFLPESELQSGREIKPPIIQGLDGVNRVTYLTSISKLQIEKVYDFYIIGVLHDIVLGKSPESPPDWVLPGIPFKIQVEKPDWMSFNTPPTVDWLPDEIEIKQGTEETIKFGQAFDFEDNKVRLEFVELKSDGEGGG